MTDTTYNVFAARLAARLESVLADIDNPLFADLQRQLAERTLAEYREFIEARDGDFARRWQEGA